MKKEFRFPTILGLVLLLVSIAAGVYLSGSKVTLGSKASGGCNPQNVQITNLTHISANISFVTTSTCRATVDINNQTITDLKLETLNNPDLATHVHYFEIKRLKEKTSYDFSLISGGNTYNDSTYKFTTGSSPSSTTPTSNLAWGKVFAPDGKTPGNAIVYLNIPGAYPLSSIVTTNGNWSISLANTFNDTKNNWFVQPIDPINEDIIVIAEDGATTQVVNSTGRNNPVPNIVIGVNSLEAASPLPTEAPQTGQLQSVTPVISQKNIDITNPKDGDMINISRPDFFGNAPANARVVIEIHSAQAINGEAITDSTGTWHWSPPSNLDPGEHTITVKSQNGATGIWETVTKKFTVLAADNGGPAFEASGSAITPTLAPTIVPTIAPTETPVPTERVARPSTTVKPPVTGNYIPTVSIIFFSFIFILISYKLLL
ncbi:MAG: Ig-like domain-containing protein [Candidatus Shapirobacteria bacterium]|jgi:hypothetical protein